MCDKGFGPRRARGRRSRRARDPAPRSSGTPAAPPRPPGRGARPAAEEPPTPCLLGTPSGEGRAGEPPACPLRSSGNAGGRGPPISAAGFSRRAPPDLPRPPGAPPGRAPGPRRAPPDLPRPPGAPPGRAPGPRRAPISEIPVVPVRFHVPRSEEDPAAVPLETGLVP